MSTIVTDTVKSIPAGSWALDAVHSHVGFEIGYLGGTFRGTFTGVEATLADGGAGRLGQGRERPRAGREPDRPPARPRLLRRRASSRRSRSPRRRSTRDGGQLKVDGTLTIKGITKPVELEGTVVRAGHRSVRPRARSASSWPRRSTAREFGLNWNVPLPSGEPALSNDVRISTQLFFIKEA